jgi:hypothetical protein
MAAVDSGLNSAKGANKGNTAAVVMDAAISAGTRNHNPSKIPIKPAPSVNNMASSLSECPRTTPRET